MHILLCTQYLNKNIFLVSLSFGFKLYTIKRIKKTINWHLERLYIQSLFYLTLINTPNNTNFTVFKRHNHEMN